MHVCKVLSVCICSLEIISKMDKSQFVSPRTRQFAMPHRAERQTQVYSSPESEGTNSLSISKTSRAVTAKLRNLSALLPHIVFGCGRVNQGMETAANSMKAGAIKAATEAKCSTMRRRRASSLD